MGKYRNETESYARDVGLDQYIVYTSGNAEYVCRAFPGALLTEAKWQIYKMAYDGDNNMTQLRWAAVDSASQASDAFDKIASSYASYYYGGI